MNLLFDGVREAIQLILRGDGPIFAAAWRSIWISGLAVVLAAVVGIPVGTWLGQRATGSRRLLVGLARAGISLPTVFVGLVCYSLFRSQGPFGVLDLIFTPWLILIGEFLLALPIIVSLSHSAIRGLDRRVVETAQSLGAGKLRQLVTQLSEARTGFVIALVSAFARCVTELGVAVTVGGNVARETRTLATATAMETGNGEFARGLAMGAILLLIALFVAFMIGWLSREHDDPRSAALS